MKTIRSIPLLSLTFCLQAAALGSPGPEDLSPLDIRAAVDAAALQRDLPAAERLAKETMRERSGDPLFGELMLALIEGLRSSEFDGHEEYALSYRLVRETLRAGKPLQVETQVKLVLYLNADRTTPGTRSGQPWIEQRRGDSRLWVEAWKRLDSAIEPDWDAEDLPSLKVAPPGGGPAGVAPESVKDPEQRAQYEAAIEANRRKAQRYRTQLKLRRLKDRFLPQVEKQLIAVYSQLPHDLEELEGLIEKSAPDADARHRILSAVRRATGQEESGN